MLITSLLVGISATWLYETLTWKWHRQNAQRRQDIIDARRASRPAGPPPKPADIGKSRHANFSVLPEAVDKEAVVHAVREFVDANPHYLWQSDSIEMNIVATDGRNLSSAADKQVRIWMKEAFEEGRRHAQYKMSIGI